MAREWICVLITCYSIGTSAERSEEVQEPALTPADPFTQLASVYSVQFETGFCGSNGEWVGQQQPHEIVRVQSFTFNDEHATLIWQQSEELCGDKDHPKEPSFVTFVVDATTKGGDCNTFNSLLKLWGEFPQDMCVDGGHPSLKKFENADSGPITNPCGKCQCAHKDRKVVTEIPAKVKEAAKTYVGDCVMTLRIHGKVEHVDKSNGLGKKTEEKEFACLKLRQKMPSQVMQLQGGNSTIQN